MHELGIKRFVPFLSRFSSVSADGVKIDRLNKIALEAAKQSGRGEVPTVENVVNVADVIERLKGFDKIVFPYENEREGGFDFLKGEVGSVAIIVGSEGGFSREEAAKIKEIAGGSVTLGERILRAETACVAVTAVTAFVLGEWRRQ